MVEKKKDKKKSFKEIHGKTRMGMFLKETAPDLLKGMISVAGNIIPGANIITDPIADLIKSSNELDAEQKATALAYWKVDVENIQGARDMQTTIATSANSTTLSKNFIYYLAAFWSLITAVYVYLITFTEVVNLRAADTILGFLLGTIVATIINFFFGSSQEKVNMPTIKK